jgi:hypothetical protein
MLYQYPDEAELNAVDRNYSMAVPHCGIGSQFGAGFKEQCPRYYSQALYRQHNNPSGFGDFSSRRGHAQLVNATGFHVVCVSANDKDGMQDGAIMLRFQNKGVKDNRCTNAPY